MPFLIANQGMDVDIAKRHIGHQLEAHHDHSGDPEKENIEAGYENRSGIENLEVSGLFRPAQRGKGPQGGREPGIEDIGVPNECFPAAFWAERRRLTADYRDRAFENDDLALPDMGKGFGLVLMILGGLQIFSGGLVGGFWLIFIGMFLRRVADMGYQDILLKQALEGVRARDMMVHEVVSVAPEMSVNRVISEYFLRYGYGGFPVTRNGNVMGVISLTNVKEVPEKERDNMRVDQVMIPLSPKIQIVPEATLAEALTKMSREGVARLLVMQHDKMIGMITRTGLLRYLEIRRTLEA